MTLVVAIRVITKLPVNGPRVLHWITIAPPPCDEPGEPAVGVNVAATRAERPEHDDAASRARDEVAALDDLCGFLR